MYDRNNPNKGNPPKSDDCNCKDNDTATQKTITAQRTIYCDDLYAAAGEVYQWEESYSGLKELMGYKKCMFVWTEENYQVYRNLEICVGTELIQVNDTIKDNIAGYIKENKSLGDTLKDILKKVKDVKSKVYDLREMACKLENCMKDSCNCNQMTILLGKAPDNCKDKTGQQPPPSGNRPSACDDVENIFNDLKCMPKSLALDIDSIFAAAADVVGIQVFSNINTLDGLQKTLYDQAKAFDKQVQDAMKKGSTDLQKAQDDLIKTGQDLTKSSATLYSKRSDFEGLFETVEYFCCPPCDCVNTESRCEERLKNCKEKICGICDDVKNTFCSEPPSGNGGSKQC